MSTNPAASFLDFFVLEASEYVERLDGFLQRASDAGPDAEGVQRAARALRGSATMAKLPSFAELASAVEAVGRGIREGSLGWEPSLKGALTAAVDDLKILVRAARAWSPAEDQWAQQRVAELGQFVKYPASAATPIASTSPTYFANESNNVAAGLELLATRPDNREAALNVLQRVRALRGVAGVQDIPALGEVSEAAEAALRPVEQGEQAIAPERVNLVRAAAGLLRSISQGIVGGTPVTVASPAYRAYLSALDGMLAHGGLADRVIPIANLFYNDAGPHIISTASNPPTTPIQRFRMEVVSLGEHLHRVIEEARQATEEIQREHARGELGRALRAIRATAASFGQMAVAQAVEAYLERTGDLNVSALDAISSFAATISPAASAPTPTLQPAVPPLRMSQAQRAVANIGMPRAEAPPPHRPSGPAARTSGSMEMTPQSRTAPRPTPAQSPSHARVFEAPTAPMAATPARGTAIPLDNTIAAFDALAGERLAEPLPVAEEVIPVDALLYRGRAALDRAIELRDQMRKASGPPAPELLEELYDLVELARAD
ncbi:MAG TPA: Hpt domain-containing protein [Gemmatimonadaceae bacterium]|nr:Hpt domain-containing protein [Gemmatimonadaceae bacterium]